VRQSWLPDWRTKIPAPAITTAGEIGKIVVETSGGDEAAEQHLRQALTELAAYFDGTLHDFTVALDPQGAPFFRRAWAEVARVPYGETRSYGEIARIVGAPAATRAVGAANGANPVAPFVPCQRIVGSDGKLTGYGPGLPLKQRLLAMEGAIPTDAADYPAWVERVAARLGSHRWVLGLRRTQIYCAPLEAPAAQRLLPNRLFATAAEAEAAGYRPA
jgi:O-6-methylguanine DNA methyltransferase